MRSLSRAIEKGTGLDEVRGGPLGWSFFGLMLFAAGTALGWSFFGLMLFAAGTALGWSFFGLMLFAAGTALSIARLVSVRAGILEASRFDDWPANGRGSWRGSIATELTAAPRPRLPGWAFTLPACDFVPLGALDARIATLDGGLLALLFAGNDFDIPARPLDGRWLRVGRALGCALVGLRELLADDLAVGLAGRSDFCGFALLPFDTIGGLLFVRAFGAGATVRLDFAGFLFGILEVFTDAFERCDFEAGGAGLVDVRRVERVREVMIGWQQPAHWEAMIGRDVFPQVPVIFGYHRPGHWGTKNQTTAGQYWLSVQYWRRWWRCKLRANSLNGWLDQGL